MNAEFQVQDYIQESLDKMDKMDKMFNINQFICDTDQYILSTKSETLERSLLVTLFIHFVLILLTCNHIQFLKENSIQLSSVLIQMKLFQIISF